MSSSASSRRAATTSIRRRPTTIPDLVPPHGYLAFYLWLRDAFGAACDRPHRQARQSRMAARQGAGAVGRLLARGGARAAAASLSVHRQRSRRGHAGQAPRRGGHHRSPDAAADPRRDLWPSEATSKRWSTNITRPPSVDPRRAAMLRRRDPRRSRGRSGSTAMSASTRDDADDDALRALDAHLCELKEMQIRDGLHVFGASPEGRAARPICWSRWRALPRGRRRPQDASLLRALADDLGACGFDPLDCAISARRLDGPAARPRLPRHRATAPWRTAWRHGRARSKLLALATGRRRDGACDRAWTAHARRCCDWIDAAISRPRLDACGAAEIGGAARRPRRPLRRARPVRRADARAARRAADRPQFLFGRQPRRADADRLGARPEVAPSCWSSAISRTHGD